MRKIYLILIIIYPILLLSQSKKGFIIPDSLRNKSYHDLNERYSKELDTKNNLSKLYANAFISKAKSEKNDLQTADGYLMQYRLMKNDSAILYLDSMLVVSNRMNNAKYIGGGNMFKGNFYFLKGRYTKALSYYILAREYSLKNSETYNIINFNIGLLKLELGNYEEANKLFFDYKKYMEVENKTTKVDYLSCLFAIAFTYSKMNQLDLSESFIEKGIKINNQLKDKESYSNFLLVSGINSYKKDNYSDAINKLEKASFIYKQNSYNDQSLMLCELYIGKSYYKTKNNKYIDKFKFIDSIIVKEKNLNIELREIYPVLIDFYEKRNDKEKQLLYVEHLLIVDSLLSENKYNLSTLLNKKYDTPNLISEKERLISDLGSQNSKLIWTSSLIGIVTIAMGIVYFNNRRKIKFYKKQAEKLTKHTTALEAVSSNASNINDKEDKAKPNLPSEILENLKLNFEKFETDFRFLNKNLTMDILAKEFNTNRDYLSRGVNELKGKNFSQYINELRINYIVKELKKNSTLQKYTIAGIAEEAGYNNSESFTTSFKKITGTLPSYFIKALKEKYNHSRESS